MTKVWLSYFLGRNGDAAIAFWRVALALALFLISMFDPEHIGFVSEPDDLLFLGYLVLAIVAAILARWHWYWDFRFLPVFLVLDWLIYLAAPVLDESPSNGHLAAVLTLAVLILMETALRWSWRHVCLAALGLNIACWITCVVLEVQMGHFDPAHAVRRISLMLVVTGVILTAVLSVRNWGPAIPTPPETPDRPKAISEALALAGRTSGGQGAVLCWIAPGDQDCRLHFWGSARGARAGTDKDSCCLRPIVDRGPSLFSLSARQWLWVDELGALHHGAMSENERAILSGIGSSDGLYLPFDNVSGTGSLVVLDLANLGWSHAWLAVELSQTITRYLDDSMTLMRNQEAALAAQRTALARDLHDSVAQSLAGALFWLKSLEVPGSPGGSVKASLDRICKAIDGEIYNINLMITRLRQAELSSSQIDLPAEMAEQCRRLASHWQVAVQLTALSSNLQVSSSLAYELFQMLREAIANAVRHAGARNIAVLLETIEGNLVFTVENDATLPLPSQSPYPHSLNSRVLDLGGQLQVMTSRKRVTMEFHVPLGERS